MNNKRIISIDILKGLAMIMVIMHHYEQSFGLCKWFHYLQMGCPIFFVCSGFGIMTLINRKFGGKITSKNIKEFYFSRFKALAPGWYLAFLLVFIINTVLLYFGKSLPFGKNRDVISILLNLLFLNGLFPFCNNNVMFGGWYIGTTVILYALTPLILYLFNKFKNRKLFFVVSSIIDMSCWLILYLLLKDYWSLGAGYEYFIFFVHYPSYLLGIILYYDLKDEILSRKMVTLCLPVSLIVLAIAILFFYSGLICGSILSSWLTALFAYLILYFLIKNEKEMPLNKLKILQSFGENSYGIYLLHELFTCYAFVSLVNKAFSLIGLSIKNLVGLFATIPMILFLCWITGVVFNTVTKKITKLMFK